MKKNFSEKSLFILRLHPRLLVRKNSIEKLSALLLENPPDSLPPIHWNLPAEILKKAPQKDFTAFLKKRLKNTGDRLFFTGRLGIPHAFLNKEQIKEDYYKAKELLEDSFKNHGEKQWYMPWTPDFSREELLPFYSFSSPLYLQPHKKDMLLAVPERNGFLPLTQVDADGRPELDSFFSSCHKSSQALLVKIGSGEDLDMFATFLTLYRSYRKEGDIFCSFDEMLRTAGGEISVFRDLPLYTNPEETLSPESCFSCSWRRFYTLMEQKKNPELKLPERIFIADMLGSVAMEGDAFFAHFERGRFSGLSRRGLSKKGILVSGDALLPRKPAAWGFFLDEKKQFPAAETAAYSTEGENFRGLREIIRFTPDLRFAQDSRTASSNPPGLSNTAGKKRPAETGPQTRGCLSLEYSFHRDYPHLLVYGTLQMPELPAEISIRRYSLVEMALFDLGAGDVPLRIISAGKNGGGRQEREILPRESAGESSFTLQGRSFHFALGDRAVVIEVPGAEDRPYILPAAIKKRFGRFSLWVNPMGSYLPIRGEELSGLKESFAFSLWAGSSADKPESAPPQKLFKDFPGYASWAD